MGSDDTYRVTREAKEKMEVAQDTLGQALSGVREVSGPDSIGDGRGIVDSDQCSGGTDHDVSSAVDQPIVSAEPQES